MQEIYRQAEENNLRNLKIKVIIRILEINTKLKDMEKIK